MAEAVRVSQSRVKTWRMCKYAHKLKFVEHLKRKEISRPLTFGGLVHDAIDLKVSGKNPFRMFNKIRKTAGDLFKEERDTFLDIVDDAEVIIAEYFDYYANDDVKRLRINGKVAEHKFEIELEPGILMTGKMDGIVETKNGRKWVEEHKTFSNMPSIDDRWRNLQTAVYFKVAEALNVGKIDGVFWDYIWSKRPTLPSVNKDGSISKKRIVTLPSALEAWATGAGVKLERIKRQIEVAVENRKLYFQRTITPLNKTVRNELFEDFKVSAREIAEHDPNTRCPKTIDRHCMWCDFEKICRAELTGSDVDFIKQKEFVKDDYQAKKKSDGKEGKPGGKKSNKFTGKVS